MARRLKILTGLSTIALSGALAVGGCAKSAKEAEPAATPQPEMAEQADGAAHHGGEAEGEGAAPAAAPAGGEAEGGTVADAAHDKTAYLSALQLVRGHMRAGVELYSAGDRELGPQHMRHPQAEILTTLAPAFSTWGASNIEPAIDALASAGEAGASPAQIGELENAALRAVSEAASAADATVKEKLLAASKTLTVAADEYSVAIIDGAMANLHEYHDAYGFMAVALDDLQAMKGAGAAENDAIAKVIEQVKIARDAAPTVTPPASGFKPASLIYGAAARIEIAARGL